MKILYAQLRGLSILFLFPVFSFNYLSFNYLSVLYLFDMCRVFDAFPQTDACQKASNLRNLTTFDAFPHVGACKKHLIWET